MNTILILLLLVLVIYIFFIDKESFTSTECPDFSLFTYTEDKYNNKNDCILDCIADTNDKNCETKCRTKCDDVESNINDKKPERIKNVTLEIFNNTEDNKHLNDYDELFLVKCMWERPKTFNRIITNYYIEIEHVYSDANTNLSKDMEKIKTVIRVQGDPNKELSHYIRGLKENNTYKIIIYAETINGISKGSIGKLITIPNIDKSNNIPSSTPENKTDTLLDRVKKINELCEKNKNNYLSAFDNVLKNLQ